MLYGRTNCVRSVTKMVLAKEKKGPKCGLVTIHDGWPIMNCHVAFFKFVWTSVLPKSIFYKLTKL